MVLFSLWNIGLIQNEVMLHIIMLKYVFINILFVCCLVFSRIRNSSLLDVCAVNVFVRMDSNYTRMPPTHPTNNGAVNAGDQMCGGPTSQKPPRNFKLLSDPALTKGVTKLYRFDGFVPNDPTYPPVMPRDPRNPVLRLRAKPVEPMVLSVPR